VIGDGEEEDKNYNRIQTGDADGDGDDVMGTKYFIVSSFSSDFHCHRTYTYLTNIDDRAFPVAV